MSQSNSKGKVISKKKIIKENSSFPAHNLFVRNGFNGSDYFETKNSSDLPRSLLVDRNKYGDNTIAVGGYLEMEPISSWWGNSFKEGNTTGEVNGVSQYGSGTSIGLSAATIDVMANAGDWVQVFTQTDVHDGANLMSAFVNIGNFDKTPFYLTVGKDRIRFGQFSGAPWATSIPQGIFRPGRINNATAGYSSQSLDAYLSYVPGSDGQAQTAMASAFYHHKIGQTPFTYSIDGGYLNDLTLSGSSMGQTLTSPTPAADIDAGLGYKKIGFSGGRVSTLKASPLTQGAQARAWWSQVSYTANLFSKEVKFAVNYSKAKNTENVAMPLAGDIKNGPTLLGVKSDMLTYADTQVTKNINMGIEYARMATYTQQKTNAVTFYCAFFF